MNNKVLKNAFAQFFGKLLTVLVAFVVVKIISGFGTTFYGNYVTTYEFLAFFGILADAGLFAIAVREISKFEQKQKTGEALLSPEENTKFILGNILSMRLLLILGATLFAGITAQFIPSFSLAVKLGIWITGLSMALTIVAGTLSSILQARMKIHFFSGSLVIGKIVLAILIFLISFLWSGIKAPETLFFLFLWAGVISNLIFCLLVYFFVSREIKIQLKFNFDWWKKVFKVSLPYGAALVLQTLYLRVDLILISIILGAGAVGIYGVSARVLESFLVLGVFFGQAILPKISAEEHCHKTSSKTLSWGIEKLLIFSLPILIGVYFFAPDIILLLSSEEFLSKPNFFGADKILLILTPTVFFAYFNQLFSFSLVSKNRQSYLLFVNATALIFNVLLNILFLKKFGIKAAAFSTIFCETLVFLLLSWEISKHFTFYLSLSNILYIFGINTVLFGIIFLTPLKQNLILAIVFCSLIYLSFLWRFRKKLLTKE
ncbi:polysaccharide biosynthesis C-terminal domain-containing protein [Candidatus Gracilibacteria bacterium]|nr:polysaccharide biosynthesis C-terminal domain-containing protein [Candidatus Gracilibacteria bacterium]